VLLTFSQEIQAADAERRTVSGLVAPYGEVGNTSVGRVVFERGSIAIPDATKIKLLSQHQQDKPVGRAISFSESADGIYGSFRLSSSTRGQDALVSLVESAAFSSASVTDIAAARAALEAATSTKTTTIATTIVEIETETETESEDAAMTTAPEPTTPDAPAEQAVDAAKVEASRPIIRPSVLDSQRVRHDITSIGAYTSRKVQAALGDEESKLYVTAADDFSSAGLGFNPTQYMKDIVSTQGNFGRPAFECVDRQAAPTSGLTINRPKFTTYPTTTVEAEGGAVSNTDAVSEYLSCTMQKYSGMQTLSIELTQYSDPGFMEAVTKELVNNDLKVTDAAVIAALTAGGTQATAVAATSAGIISYISTEAPLAYTSSSYFAKNYLAGSSQWSLLLGATDTTGRPIYSAANPMNNGGNAATTSAKGSVLGLDLFIDRNVVSTTIDESAFIIAPEAFTVFESPQAFMSVNVVANLQVQIAVYGMLGTMVNVAGGIRRFNLT
jgi:phage head maturation protease